MQEAIVGPDEQGRCLARLGRDERGVRLAAGRHGHATIETPVLLVGDNQGGVDDIAEHAAALAVLEACWRLVGTTAQHILEQRLAIVEMGLHRHRQAPPGQRHTGTAVMREQPPRRVTQLAASLPDLFEIDASAGLRWLFGQ
ncbi:hypothetical protein D3C72_1891460 [compost metagenome]